MSGELDSSDIDALSLGAAQPADVFDRPPVETICDCFAQEEGDAHCEESGFHDDDCAWLQSGPPLPTVKPSYLRCDICGAENQIKNQCGCDPDNLPTRVPTAQDIADEMEVYAGEARNAGALITQSDRRLLAQAESPPREVVQSGPFAGFEVISTYTREQALDDGTLVDAMVGDFADVSRQHYKWPIAMTSSVFVLMENTIRDCPWQDYAGIWHDILWMSKMSPDRKQWDRGCIFTVLIGDVGKRGERKCTETLKIVSGPGDHGEPVLTVMLEHED